MLYNCNKIIDHECKINLDFNRILDDSSKKNMCKCCLTDLKNLCKVSNTFIKEAKGVLRLGKSQSRDFASQIASASLTVIKYNILSTVKQFATFQTIGGLFCEATGGVIQLSVTERIWGVLQEIVRTFEEAFETNDDKVMDNLIIRSETFSHYINSDKLELK